MHATDEIEVRERYSIIVTKIKSFKLAIDERRNQMRTIQDLNGTKRLKSARVKPPRYITALQNMLDRDIQTLRTEFENGKKLQIYSIRDLTQLENLLSGLEFQFDCVIQSMYIPADKKTEPDCNRIDDCPGKDTTKLSKSDSGLAQSVDSGLAKSAHSKHKKEPRSDISLESVVIKETSNNFETNTEHNEITNDRERNVGSQASSHLPDIHTSSMGQASPTSMTSVSTPVPIQLPKSSNAIQLPKSSNALSDSISTTSSLGSEAYSVSAPVGHVGILAKPRLSRAYSTLNKPALNKTHFQVQFDANRRAPLFKRSVIGDPFASSFPEVPPVPSNKPKLWKDSQLPSLNQADAPLAYRPKPFLRSKTLFDNNKSLREKTWFY